MRRDIYIMVLQVHANVRGSPANICNASSSLACMNGEGGWVGGWRGGRRRKTEVKPVKDAEFDQRYIPDAKHTVLCAYPPPPHLNVTDVCKFKMPFS